MSENTAKSTSGGSRKEIAKKEVSQEEINRHIAAFTGNPETTIVICTIDTAFLKETKPVKGGYVDFGQEGKGSLQELEENKGLIISTHPSREKGKDKDKDKSRKGKDSVKDKKEKESKEDMDRED